MDKIYDVNTLFIFLEKSYYFMRYYSSFFFFQTYFIKELQNFLSTVKELNIKNNNNKINTIKKWKYLTRKNDQLVL